MQDNIVKTFFSQSNHLMDRCHLCNVLIFATFFNRLPSGMPVGLDR